MKPERIAMTHSLINSYHIYRNLDVYMARQASKQEMTKFHTPDYINYLEKYITK
jgi:histone deacetylase 1/2